MSTATSLPQITVCDDFSEQAQEWVRDLSSRQGVTGAFEVRCLDKTEFRDAIEALEQRRSSLRKSGDLPSGDRETPFDISDVLIVDFDLFDFEPEGQRVTGRDVAYLARCFSDCGYVVGVNLDKVTNPFDLSLTDHPDSFVDLALGGSQVARPGLWEASDEVGSDFRPWSWPLIPERARFLRSQAKALESRIDEPLEDLLELPAQAVQALTRDRLSALEIPDDPGDSLSASARHWLTAAAMGIDQKDVLADDLACARVLAARLLKWCESVLLPGQDVFVDAPHLIERRPGLLSEDSTDLESWQQLCRLDLHTSDLPVRHDLIAAFQWSSPWIGRPVWLWPLLATDPEVERTRKAPRPDPRQVFAEDVSAFVERESATRFEARLDSAFSTRWVARPDPQEVQYIPSSLMASG